MASVFQRKGRDRWIIQYTDQTGKRRERSSRTTDYGVAVRIGEALDTRVAELRFGLVDVRAEAVVAHEHRAISEHIADFATLLRARGRSEVHVVDTKRAIERVTTQLRAKRLTDLSAFKVQVAVTELRDEPVVVRRVRHRRSSEGGSPPDVVKRPMHRSARTCNKLLQAMTSFTRWLTRDGRMTANPLLAVRRLNVEVDRRRRRRALTSDEVCRLIGAAEAGPTYLGLSGRDRSALYRLALGTGFRASELASLTPANFNLEGEHPTVTCPAGYSKRRREDVQPIQVKLAVFLKAWLSKRFRKARVFATTRLSEKTAKMMSFDLGRAGIAELDANGESADFHALRHTFVSRVVRAGATVSEAQILARHASPVMTFGLYAHATTDELARVVSHLPHEERQPARSAE